MNSERLIVFDASEREAGAPPFLYLAQTKRVERKISDRSSPNSSPTVSKAPAAVAPKAKAAPPKHSHAGEKTPSRKATTFSDEAELDKDEAKKVMDEIEQLVKNVKNGALEMNQMIALEKKLLDSNADLLEKNIDAVQKQSNSKELEAAGGGKNALDFSPSGILTALTTSPTAAFFAILQLLWAIIKPIAAMVIVGAVTAFALFLVLMSPKPGSNTIIRCDGGMTGQA